MGYWLIALCHLLTAGAFLVAIPDHAVDPEWPVHARNHVLQALFWVVGLNLISIALALFRKDDRSRVVWTLLLLSGLFLYGGYFLAILITSGGAPGPADDLYFGAIASVYAVGLAFTYSATSADEGKR